MLRNQDMKESQDPQGKSYNPVLFSDYITINMSKRGFFSEILTNDILIYDDPKLSLLRLCIIEK